MNGKWKVIVPASLLGWTIFVFISGWIFSAGRNEARLSAVEEYIRVHQIWASQRSEVVVQNTQDIVQLKYRVDQNEQDIKELSKSVWEHTK